MTPLGIGCAPGDVKATRVGDLLTVIIVEESETTLNAKSSSTKKSDMGRPNETSAVWAG